MFESLKIADALCFNRADDQGLPDALKYRAWLSDSTTDARDRFTRGRGRLVLVNGLVLASSWSALLAGALENNFEVTEKKPDLPRRGVDGDPARRHRRARVPALRRLVDQLVPEDGALRVQRSHNARMDPVGTVEQPERLPSEYALYCLQSL